MVDSGANINCVCYDWIACFETTEWNYALECGSVKAAGGHILDVEARVVLKISLPPEDPVPSANQWFHIVRSPSLGAYNYPIFLSRRFHRPIYF